MRLELAKYLYDIQQAVSRLSGFVEGRDWVHYERDAMLRAAVERQFEIIGEALAQLAKRDAAVAARIREHQRIIAFRNILIHGYAEIDDRLVWDIVQTRLPTLRQDLDALIGHAPPEFQA